jgi:4'-phosphopantetheinyl transferase
MSVSSTSVASVSSVVNNSRGPLTTEDAEKRHALAANEVHVWRVSLDQSSERTELSLGVLSTDERRKATRFRFAKDRNQFVQARAALRFILSDYLNLRAQSLEFSYGTHGKPALANGEAGLRFNLSRRDGLALIAVTRGREIGVDVELIRADVPCFEIAGVSFSLAESATLRSLPESLRSAGFYNCWTRKEAYVKARGEGLSFPLQQFDVSLAPGAAAKLLRVGDDDNDVDRWTLQEIPVGENYVAALAVEGSNLNVMCRDWALPLINRSYRRRSKFHRRTRRNGVTSLRDL